MSNFGGVFSGWNILIFVGCSPHQHPSMQPKHLRPYLGSICRSDWSFWAGPKMATFQGEHSATKRFGRGYGRFWIILKPFELFWNNHTEHSRLVPRKSRIANGKLVTFMMPGLQITVQFSEASSSASATGNLKNRHVGNHHHSQSHSWTQRETMMKLRTAFVV